MPVIVQIGDHALVMVDEESLKRISKRDPMILNIAKLERDTGRPIARVVVTLGTSEDIQEVARLVTIGDAVAVFDYACRGWETKPEDALPTVRISTSAPPETVS